MNIKISGFVGFAEWICNFDFVKVTGDISFYNS